MVDFHSLQSSFQVGEASIKKVPSFVRTPIEVAGDLLNAKVEKV
jgi:hypothetical protein